MPRRAPQSRPTLTSHVTRLTLFTLHVALLTFFPACAPQPSPNAAKHVDVRIPVAASIVLAGTLTRPAPPGRTPPPVVLLVGGSGPQDRDGARAELPGYRPFRDLALALGAAGIAVLRLDDRGTGASSGRFAGATTIDFASDVAAALRWLRGRKDVDGRRVALLGHSEGAVVALLAASRDSSVAALVLLGAPSRTGRELARWQRAALVAADLAAFPPSQHARLLSRAEADAERTANADAWLRVWFALDPRTVARATTAPVLLLHGENDRRVPVEQAEELASVLAARPAARPASRVASRPASRPASHVTLRRFPATDHLFLEDHDGDPRGYVRIADRRVRSDVAAAITEWLREQMRTHLAHAVTDAQ